MENFTPGAACFLYRKVRDTLRPHTEQIIV